MPRRSLPLLPKGIAMLARLSPFILALGLGLVAGCGPAKLNETKTWPGISSGDIKALDVPAITKPQKVTVEFTSSSADVTVIAVKESDARGDKGLQDADPSKALAKKSGKSGEFAVDVPENTAIRVIVLNVTAKTDVTVKVTNSK
jgi:hypothetical protein